MRPGAPAGERSEHNRNRHQQVQEQIVDVRLGERQEYQQADDRSGHTATQADKERTNQVHDYTRSGLTPAGDLTRC